MSRTAHDAAFEKLGAMAVDLHVPVVVRLERQGVQSPEVVKDMVGDAAEVSITGSSVATAV